MILWWVSGLLHSSVPKFIFFVVKKSENYRIAFKIDFISTDKNCSQRFSLSATMSLSRDVSATGKSNILRENNNNTKK